MKRNLILFTISLWLFAGFSVKAQYYYFDTVSTSYPYQQWCSETLNVRINTEWHAQWARAGRFHLILDPTVFSYSTTMSVPVLRSDLFTANSSTFMDWSAESSPSWKAGSNQTILQIDRKNNTTDYKWTNWLYWTIKFVPVYNPNPYQWSFSMEYNPGPDTTETTLSMAGWVEIINPSSQWLEQSKTYDILQAPCVADTNSPTITINTPVLWNKRSHTAWITLSLADNAGVSGIANVPYVWSGWVWTGNVWWTRSNQSWIDPESFVLYVSGNWESRMFTNDNTVFATWPELTWQDNARNFQVLINSASLFDRWIEQTITITGTVKDRDGNTYNLSPYIFNEPQIPTLIPGSQLPAPNAVFVNTTDDIILWLQDERAGVDPDSIVVTLLWINDTEYWPFVFSGSDLNLSGVNGIANGPDYFVKITNNENFPTSGAIRVSVSVEDFAWNVWNISDYTFYTRPDCSEFQCCDPVLFDINWNQFYYPNPILNVFDWINVNLDVDDDNITGVLYCNTEDQWMLIYSWNWSGDENASLIKFFDSDSLLFSGENVIIYLTGENNDTVLIMRLWDFEIIVRPWSRPAENFANLWELRFYDQDKNLIVNWEIETDSDWLTDWMYNIPSGTYYVVYKWQSHLASYLTDVEIVQWVPQTFDFTTWANLHNTQDKSISEDDGYQYQIAWDLENVQWYYDFMINGNDIAILTADWFEDSGIDVLDPKNLNGDWAINVSDIAVIGINFEQTDPYFDSEVFVW